MKPETPNPLRNYRAAIIKECRKAAGMTQTELAAALGKSRRIVQAWELGTTTPDKATIYYCQQLAKGKIKA